MTTTERPVKTTSVRIDSATYERVKLLANKERRSGGRQIQVILEKWLEDAEREPQAE